MSARSRPHLIPTAAVVAALGLAAPATALAVPAPEDCACGGAATRQAALPAPRPLKRPVNDSFHWDDAGIGAGGAILLVLTGVGATALVRRRREPDPPLPA